MAAPDTGSLLDIYQALKRGMGRERVDDANVDALIEMARERGEVQLELLLREWRSPCGDDPDAPDLRDLPAVPPH
jgi:hypothetical protein